MVHYCHIVCLCLVNIHLHISVLNNIIIGSDKSPLFCVDFKAFTRFMIHRKILIHPPLQNPGMVTELLLVDKIQLFMCNFLLVGNSTVP